MQKRDAMRYARTGEQEEEGVGGGKHYYYLGVHKVGGGLGVVGWWDFVHLQKTATDLVVPGVQRQWHSKFWAVLSSQRVAKKSKTDWVQTTRRPPSTKLRWHSLPCFLLARVVVVVPAVLILRGAQWNVQQCPRIVEEGGLG
jgi:hypothetical protein